MPKLYRDATTGQYTTAEDAAARPAETVSESVPVRHETPTWPNCADWPRLPRRDRGEPST